MGAKHQDRWMDHLPFVLLGRRTALQPDLGATASELTFGKNVVVPGQLLEDPDEVGDQESLQSLLQRVRNKTERPAIQTSRHIKQEQNFKPLPEDINFVYTKQHQTTGLQPSFEGPFRIAERLSRSTFKLEVGTFKDGTKRYEIRHANDLKFAHPKSLTAPAVRPTLGRPSSSSSDAQLTALPSHPTPSNQFDESEPASSVAADQNKQTLQTRKDATTDRPTHETSNQNCRVPASIKEGGQELTGPPKIQPFSGRPTRTTRNPNPIYVDGIQLESNKPWSASSAEIQELNRMIGA